MSVKVDIKEIGPCKKQFSIFIPPEMVDEAFEKNLDEVAGTIQLKGFRRGKVPRKLIEKRYSKEIEQDLQGQLAGEHYSKALEEHSLSPLADPAFEDLDFDREKGFSFTASVEVHPEIALKDYKGVSLEKEPVSVDDSDVDATLENLRRERATLESSDKPSVEGNHLTVKVAVTVEGKEILTREHAHAHVGHDHIAGIDVKGLGKKLIGVSVGDTVETEITLDDSFPLEDHRGQKAKIQLNVEEVKAEALPELDEKFLKSFNCSTEDELKDRIREDILKHKEGEAEEALCEVMLDKIAKDLDIPIPEGLLRRQCVNLVQQTPAIYKVAGAKPDEREAILEEEIKNVTPAATTQVRNFFILDAVAKKEKIFVTEKEMAEQLYQVALSRGQSPEELSKELRENGGLTEMRLGLRERKTVKWLLDKADVKEGKPSKKAAEKSSTKKATPKKKSAKSKKKDS